MFALALVSLAVPLHGAVSYRERTTFAPETYLFSADRSFGGEVEEIFPNGLIRLRDGLAGDIDLVLTDATLASHRGAHTLLRKIRVGSYIHGSGAFRGGRYFVKVLTIDS